MEFSGEEIERYARHIVLAGVGGPGQQKLKRARVLVVGRRWTWRPRSSQYLPPPASEPSELPTTTASRSPTCSGR